MTFLALTPRNGAGLPEYAMAQRSEY